MSASLVDSRPKEEWPSSETASRANDRPHSNITLVSQPQYPAGLFDLGTSQAAPPPQPFVVQDLIPAGCVTSLFAKGGSSKSFLALLLGFAVVRGTDFLGCAVQDGNVLYLDAELDQATAERRAWMIATGLGLKKPPNGLVYHRLSGSLTDKACNHQVREMIALVKPRLTIIDSFTAAMRGKDVNSLDDVSERLLWLNDFGTVLMIDHTAKSSDPSAGGMSAFGSVAKSIFARSMLSITSNGRASILRHEKANFGPQIDAIRYALNFGSDAVTLEFPLSANDPRLSGIEGALPLVERVRQAITGGDYPDGVMAKELAEGWNVNSGSISNALTQLKREGVAQSSPQGRWQPVPALAA